jgi:hypothetical protein
LKFKITLRTIKGLNYSTGFGIDPFNPEYIKAMNDCSSHKKRRPFEGPPIVDFDLPFINSYRSV